MALKLVQVLANVLAVFGTYLVGALWIIHSAPPLLFVLKTESIMLDGMYQDDDGDYVLTNVPSPPKGFFNLTTPFDQMPGYYLVGLSQFVVKPFTIAPIFHRQFGSADDILVGVFTVILIAVLADIVQTILLHTLRNRSANLANRLVFAAFVDEVSHFRNICKYVERKLRSQDRDIVHGNGKENKSQQRRPSRPLRAAASAFAIAIALLLFVVEVLAVVLTQPRELGSSPEQYNVRAFHPAGTTIGMAKFVRRTMGLRGCVSPVMTPQTGPRRNFLIHSYVDFKEGGGEVRYLDEDVVKNVTVTSFYHRGGSDHQIEYGQEMYNVSVRSELFLGREDDTAWRIMYENRDDEKMSHALYLQRRFIYAAVEYSCNKNYSQISCEAAAEALQEVKTEKVEQAVRLWRGKADDVVENVTGLMTRFRTQINSPFKAVNAAVRELMVSGVIEEVEGEAKYESVRGDESATGIAGLLSEQGRVAGVVLVLVLLASSFTVLVVLRWLLKPLSLAAVATGIMEEEKWERVEGGMLWVCPSREDDVEDLGAAARSRESSGDDM